MTEATETRRELSKEDKALLIRAAWEALLAPPWLKDDLIALGKLVYAKVPLREVDDELFAHLLPHLSTMAESLGQHLLRPQAPVATPPAPTPSPAPAQVPPAGATEKKP